MGNLKNKIMSGDLEYAERIAKNWSVMLGEPAINLLYDAQQEIKTETFK